MEASDTFMTADMTSSLRIDCWSQASGDSGLIDNIFFRLGNSGGF